MTSLLSKKSSKRDYMRKYLEEYLVEMNKIDGILNDTVLVPYLSVGDVNKDSLSLLVDRNCNISYNSTTRLIDLITDVVIKIKDTNKKQLTKNYSC